MGNNAVPLAVSVLLVFCLAALAPCAHSRAQPSSPLSNLQDSEQIAVPASADIIQVSVPQVDEPQRRLLKLSANAKTSKSKKSKKVKWNTKKNKVIVVGSVIGVAVFVGTVVCCVVFLTITEKKEQDPEWRVRDLFQRRMKPGVKRSLTRRFTRKPAGSVEDEDAMEKEKQAGDKDAAVADHPPK